jgi:hypothetical protein
LFCTVSVSSVPPDALTARSPDGAAMTDMELVAPQFVQTPPPGLLHPPWMLAPESWTTSVYVPGARYTLLLPVANAAPIVAHGAVAVHAEPLPLGDTKAPLGSAPMHAPVDEHCV